MKFKFNLFFVLVLGFGLFFTSCQDEVVEITAPEEQEVITPQSSVAASMSAMTVNNGSSDDFLDNASCFSVELPVTIVTGNITIVIEDEDDLIELAEFLADFEDDDDLFDFVFPITLIFSDYTEIVLENEEQLAELVSQCVDDDVDDVIECIDFVYPISFSVFNQDFDLIDTVVVQNDETLYGFLDSLDDDNDALIVSLNYPVTLVYANGETVEVNSNAQLAEVIEAAEDSCDDDEPQVCTQEELEANLTECLWEVYDQFNDFNDFYIDFSADGTLQILAGPNNQTVQGNWGLSEADSGLILSISELTAFQEDFGGEWSIVECEGDEIYITKDDLFLELDQECDNVSDCDPYVLGEFLPICEWEIETYTSFPEFEGIDLIFYENGTFDIVQNGDTISSQNMWNIGVEGDTTVLYLDTDFEDLGADWQLIECDFDDGFEYAFQNGDNIMVIEKDCDDTNNEIFECFLSFDPFLEICDEGTDGPYEVDLTLVFANCPADSITFFESLEDATNFVNPISNPQSYAVVNTQSAVYAKIEIENQFIVLEIGIFIENCGNDNPFDCYDVGGYVLEECDEDNDGFAVFNIYEAVPSCDSNVSTIVTFHTTLQGAENNTDFLEGATAYTNLSNPQTVYVRVALFDNPAEYIVYPVELVVSDCGGNDQCSEGAISDYLQTCTWVPVSFNGDDNLIEYTMVFNSDTLVVEGNGMTATTTYSVQGSNPAFVFIDGINLPNIQALDGDWTVVSCEPDRIVLLRNDDVLILEQDCN